MRQLLSLLILLGSPSQVESWTILQSRVLVQPIGFSREHCCHRRTTLALRQQQACYDSYYDPSDYSGHQVASLELTAEQARELARAINEFNDQVQYYYEAKLMELNRILEQTRELHRLRLEYHEQLQREHSDRQFPIQSTFDNLGHGMVTEPVDAQIDTFPQSTPEEEKEKPKLNVKVPAKYYQKITPAIRPSPAPGMPNVLTAQIESMLPTLKQSQPILEISLKKNAPILAAEFEAYVVTTIQQIKIAQPLLAAELQSALTQTQQNQALLAAELSQLLVDAKQMVATYMGDLSCLDGIDASGCDLF